MIYLGQWEVESESSNATYIVSKVQTDHIYSEVTWQCGCVGWTRHVPRRDCKHILWVKAGHGRKIDPLVMAVIKARRKAA